MYVVRISLGFRCQFILVVIVDLIVATITYYLCFYYALTIANNFLGVGLKYYSIKNCVLTTFARSLVHLRALLILQGPVLPIPTYLMNSC